MKITSKNKIHWFEGASNYSSTQDAVLRSELEVSFGEKCQMEKSGGWG